VVVQIVKMLATVYGVKDPIELHSTALVVTTLSWTDPVHILHLFPIFHLPASTKPSVPFRGRFSEIVRRWDTYCDLQCCGYIHVPIFESHDCIRTS